MKKQFIVLWAPVLAIVPICFGQAKLVEKSAGNEPAIIDSEKAAWEAYKNKNADAFKRLMATDYRGVMRRGSRPWRQKLQTWRKLSSRNTHLPTREWYSHARMSRWSLTRLRRKGRSTDRIDQARSVPAACTSSAGEGGSASFTPKSRRSKRTG